MFRSELDLAFDENIVEQFEIDICKSRIYLKWILVSLLVASFLLSGILACLILVVERLFM